MGTTFSLLSMNTHGRPFPPPSVIERSIALSTHYEQVEASILCLQEVWSYRLLAVLQRHLPSYPYCAYKHGWLGPQAGLVVFSRFPLKRPHFVDIPPVAEPRKKRWINRLKRATKRKGVLQCTCMLSMLHQQSLHLWNVYLVANGDGDWSEAGRYYQAHLHDIIAVAEQSAQKTCPGARVIVGDFNIPKESSLYRTFVQHTHVYDVFENDQTPTFHAAFLAPGQQAHCIDYLFLDSHTVEHIAVRQKRYLFQNQISLPSGRDLYLSDHVGIWAIKMRILAYRTSTPTRSRSSCILCGSAFCR
jgi:Endonuclease/Exonuclease/phosphatase family.